MLEDDDFELEDDDFDDSDRYDSAVGWEPEDKYAKVREEARRNDPANYPLPFDVYNGRELARYPLDDAKPVFGGLWSEGELIILLGEAGAGKSLLAVQMLEMMARGAAIVRPGAKRGASQKVLYIDLERTSDQFVRCYSFRQHPEMGRTSRYRFSKNFSRAHLCNSIDIPPSFKDSLDRFLRYAIERLIAESAPSLVVIDSLSTLEPRLSGDVMATRVMRLLRALTSDPRVTIVATAHLRPRRRPAPLTMGDIGASRRLCDLADAVMAIGRSTLGPDLRYLKHLKSRSLPPIKDVSVFRIARMPGPYASLAAPETTLGVSVLPSPATLALPTAAIDKARSRGPQGFIGFEFIGPCDEAVHVRDYAAEARRDQITEEKRLRRIRNPKYVVDMLMSPEYRKYLKS